jgi:hypothetical protein
LAQPNELLAFTAPFKLSSDLSPDIYTVEIGLRVKATGEETWNFSMVGLANTLTINRGAMNVLVETLPIQHRLNEAIGDTGLLLLGYNDLTRQEIPRVELYWQVQRSPAENYVVELTLLDGANQEVAAWRRPLSQKTHPVESWQPGEVIKLPFSVEFDATLPPGSYRPVLSILPVNNSQASPVAQINLSPNYED